MRVQLTRLAAALACALAAGCLGASVSSVRATAAIGQRVGGFQDALDDTQRTCEKIARLTGGEPKNDCVPPDPQWRRAARVIGLYAGAMGQLATADDVEVKSQIDSTLDAGMSGQFSGASLTDKEKGIIAMVAQAITKAASEAWRLEKIKQAVLEYDPYVQATTLAMETVLAGQITMLDLLATQVDSLRTRTLELNFHDDPAAHPGDPEMARRRLTKGVLGAYLDDLRVSVSEQKRRLTSYRRVMTLFGKAHHQLHEHAGDFLDNDVQILEAIVKSIADSQSGATPDPQGG